MRSSDPVGGASPAPRPGASAAGQSGLRLTAFVCAMVLIGGLVTVAYSFGVRNAQPSAAAEVVEHPGGFGTPEGDEPVEVPSDVPEDLAPVLDLYEDLNSEAVEAPAGDAIVEGALEGMLEALDDPYATFYNEAAFAEFNELMSGEGTFSGVGMVVEETPEGIFVVTVLPDTPAERAGVESGEQIVSVNGENVRGKPIQQVTEMIKGKAGTEVRIGFAGGEAGQRELTIERAELHFPTLTSEQFDSGAGYIRLLQFTDDAGERVRDAVGQLVEQGAEGIILDLRGNPGGFLREAVEVAGAFIEDGLVVSVQERAGQREALEATGDAFEDVPLVVLVDEGSASASEIVAGAIQDAGRGTVIGQTTFGKGTVQTIRSLPDGSGFKFTTARYFTPSGDSIEGVGVKPDRLVDEDADALEVAKDVLRSLVAG